MASYGYARVSTHAQDLTIQIEKLTSAGCVIIRQEKVSGTSRTDRSELETLLTFLRAGDILTVTKIDRLARSVSDLQDIVKIVKSKGAELKAIDQPIDTNTAAGKCFLDMLGVFAEFETNLRKERQREGIERAKKEGVYKGRKKSLNTAAIIGLSQQGLGPSEIARQLKIARASVYRSLAMRGEPIALAPI